MQEMHCRGAGGAGEEREWLQCGAGGPVPGLVPVVPGLCRHTPAGEVETRRMEHGHAGITGTHSALHTSTDTHTHHTHTPSNSHSPPGRSQPQASSHPPKPSPPSFTPLSSQPSSCCSFQLPFTFPQPTLGEERRRRPPRGDPTVPGTGFGDLLSPQLQRVPRLWWLRSGERQRAAAAGCADGSRARSAWR